MTEAQGWIAITWLAVIAILGVGAGWLALLGYMSAIAGLFVTLHLLQRFGSR